VSGSGTGISWATCKSAPRSKQLTTPAPHHSVFALPATKPTASKYLRHNKTKEISKKLNRNLLIEQLVVLFEHWLNKLNLTESEANDQHQSVGLGRELVEIMASR